MSKVFGVRSTMFMVVVSIGLVVLPLVLPPLPPPPMVLMLVPLFLMSLLLMLAFSPLHCPDVVFCSV